MLRNSEKFNVVLYVKKSLYFRISSLLGNIKYLICLLQTGYECFYVTELNIIVLFVFEEIQIQYERRKRIKKKHDFYFRSFFFVYSYCFY